MESGIRLSLDSYCKHQITYCNLNFYIPVAPAYERKVWHYNRANITLIKRAVSEFPWNVHLANHDPSWQVNFFNKTLMNIMNNFIPNKYIKIQPKDPPWINDNLRKMIKKQNRQYKNFTKNGCKPEDKCLVDKFRNDCFEAINKAKVKYLSEMGTKLNDSRAAPKTYWKILNKLLNKCHIPRIPPVLSNNSLITNCKEKAKLFNNYFLSQCKPNVNNSSLPLMSYLTNKRVANVSFSNDLRSNNPFPKSQQVTWLQ